jgi:hypothetical protein
LPPSLKSISCMISIDHIMFLLPFICTSHQTGRLLELSFSERWLCISCGIQRHVASKPLLSACFARLTLRPWRWRWYFPLTFVEFHWNTWHYIWEDRTLQNSRIPRICPFLISTSWMSCVCMDWIRISSDKHEKFLIFSVINKKFVYHTFPR